MYKLLVVDDNDDILDAVAFVMARQRKMNVVACKDPALLTSYLKEHEPDIVLMDVAMGMYDGRDLCFMIKHAIEQKDRIPVILFSATTCSPDSIFESEADAYLQKPFKIQQLYDTVQKFIPQNDHLRLD